MSLTARPALALLLFGSLSIGVARADEGAPNHAVATAESVATACVHAYEQAQEERHSGKLLDARVQLASCARDVCPAFIRKDCAAWHGDLQSEIPTVVFTARSGQRDLTDVRVSLGARVLSSRIDGQAIELDPGEYEFQFAAPGMKPATQHVLISRGERNRLQRVELAPIATEREAVEPLPGARRSWLVPGVLAGVAVVGLTSFGVFAASGHAAESRLETTCSPRCSKDQVSAVRTKYTVADVSLAVGVASLGLATYFALSSNDSRESARHPSPFDVQASATGFGATYRGAF
jgi:hypothetical protein